MFMSLVYRYRWLTVSIFLWTIVFSYSRIYLGVHFISDIIGGTILGLLLGCVAYLIFQFGRKNILKDDPAELRNPIYTPMHGNIIAATILITIVADMIYSAFA
jgi:undecaprenyl-diphosphatase